KVTDTPAFPLRTSCLSNSTSVKMTRLVPTVRHSARELTTLPTKTSSARSVISSKVNGMTVVAFAVVRKIPATPTANHVRNAFTDLFIVSIMVRSVPELGTMAALPLPPNHSAFIVPFLGWKPAFALRLAMQLAAFLGPQGADDAGQLAIGQQT